MFISLSFTGWQFGSRSCRVALLDCLSLSEKALGRRVQPWEGQGQTQRLSLMIVSFDFPWSESWDLDVHGT